MKNIIYSIADIRNSIILFLLFAFFCAIATFIESSYGTSTAWAMIYGTLWFGFIQFLLGLNLLCALFKYKMFSNKKIPLFIFHISFLFILVGSIITRYWGYEGNLHIRENSQNNLIESSKSFIKFFTINDGQITGVSAQKDIALLPFANSLELDLKLGDDVAKLEYKNMILDAKNVFVEDEKYAPLLVLMIADKNNKADEIVFKEGDIKDIFGINFSFLNDNVKAPFIKIDKNLNISSSFDLKYLSMLDQKNDVLNTKSSKSVKEKALYETKDFSFVVKFASMHAKEEIKGTNRKQENSFFAWLKSVCLESLRTCMISLFGEAYKWNNPLLNKFKDFAMSEEYQALKFSKDSTNALEFKISYKGESKNVFVFEYSKPSKIVIKDKMFFISWSPSNIELPFSLYLKDFVLDRYPGSMSASSYASEVIVKDDKEFDYRIFMNNVLDYKGYRFYQSSYDKDELGTILSVNKDPGKIPTYIGYFLLSLGMFLSILNPNSRFRYLAKLINKDALKSIALISFVLFLGKDLYANDLNNTLKVDLTHNKDLKTLIVQKSSGRMIPFDTLAREILEKVHKSTSYDNQEASSVVLSMIMNFQYWSKKPFIVMPENQAINDEISKIIDIKPAKYASFMDFFTKNSYKLQKYVENANRKSPNSRGVFDKEILKLDERVNVLNLLFSGELLRIIPAQNSNNNAWLSLYSALNDTKGEENKIVNYLIRNYFASLDEAFKTNKWDDANKALGLIKLYQQKIGNSIIPDENKIAIEIFSNKLELFNKLSPIYLLAGILLLILVFVKMLNSQVNINIAFKIVYFLNILVFIIHTFGLCLRAYLADHAPWSNAYESMVYIAWALSLSGIFFSRKSPLSLALTSILAGVVLFVAHLSEMDPQITNLVPVLNSYWLSIHVSVITASYGFLGLCALLGIFVLLLFLFLKDNGKYNENIMRNITEATRINEMAMILGLCLLTVGNFLGAIWANESWGRYWSWDSKEVWALISILIYAALLHTRMIPKYANQYNFAVCSMFAYWSIIMTYFGVNYFLVGMHSYAAGEAVRIPEYVYIGFLMMVILAILAYRKRKFASKL